MNKQPVSYLQTDPKWSRVSYSAKGESTTIGRAGCGPTAMAMVLATWADPSVTPKTEAAWALAHGYKYPHQGTAYPYFAAAAKRYGLYCKQITPAYIYGNANSPYHAQAKAALDNGDLVIACMGKGLWTSSGHYVLVWKIEGNMVYINDPASTRMARTHGNYLVFKQQVKLYWIIKAPKKKAEPEPKKEEPDMTEAETRKIVKEEVAAQMGLLKPKTYDTLEELPYGQDTVKKLMDLGVLKGTGKGLDLTLDMLRVLILMDRLGAYDHVGGV